MRLIDVDELGVGRCSRDVVPDSIPDSVSRVAESDIWEAT